jgi:hypothetical protein
MPDPPDPDAGGYNVGLERRLPGCVVFLVSRAAWLRSPQSDRPTSAESIARCVNRAFGELITQCDTGGEKPHPWVDVGLIGYGTDRDGRAIVAPLFGGPLAGRNLATIPELYDHPLEIERRQKKEFVDDGGGGLQEVMKEIAFPVWYRAGGGLWSGSPMCAGLEYSRRVVARWALDHPDCFPPFVFHLTDGRSTDGDPAAAFRRLRAVSTADGALFLVNVQYAGDDPAAFLPAAAPTEEARRLHEAASPVPSRFRAALDVVGMPTEPGCRALVVNADPIRLLRLLPTGTSYPLHWGCATLPPHLR